MSYHPKAHQLGNSFQLKSLLLQRGLVLESEDNLDRTLYGHMGINDKEGFYNFISKNEKRKNIRESIYKNLPFNYNGKDFSLNQNEEKKFTSAFEWYVAEALLKEFGFFTTGFGITIKDAPVGTEFDALGFGLDLFTHIECKTGSPTNFSRKFVENFKAKCDFLSADINIFYIDYNGLSYDQHHILKLFPEVFFERGSAAIYKIKKEGMGCEIYKVDIAPVFIIDTNKSSKSPLENLRQVFNIYFKLKHLESVSMGYSPDDLQTYGFQVEKMEKNYESKSLSENE